LDLFPALGTQLVDPINPNDLNPDPPQMEEMPQLPNQEVGARNNILIIRSHLFFPTNLLSLLLLSLFAC
jgi:hypothetical protein